MFENFGLESNADINAALNIARKAGYTPPTPTRIETYIPTHQGVTPLTEKKKTTTGSKTINPRRGNPGAAPQWRRAALFHREKYCSKA
ncbi:MAG: hypothetical protein ACP5GL_04300 [Infirmifilum sp.]